MKRILAALLIAASTSAGAFGWVLVNSYYDASAGGWVCTYRSPQGTLLTQVQRGICSLSPQ